MESGNTKELMIRIQLKFLRHIIGIEDLVNLILIGLIENKKDRGEQQIKSCLNGWQNRD